MRSLSSLVLIVAVLALGEGLAKGRFWMTARGSVSIMLSVQHGPAISKLGEALTDFSRCPSHTHAQQ